jgi:hypothetical protein
LIENIFILDESLVRPEVIEKLNNGTARIVNGVAREFPNRSSILQHMPFREISVKESSDLLQSAKLIQQSQAMTMAAISVSTVAIMGAVIVATAYLSKKIDKLQDAIDDLQKEIGDQNLLFYAEKISFYFGSIESLRELIKDKDVVEENKDIIINSLSYLLISRSQLLSFIDNLIYLSDSFSDKHKEMVIEFINLTLELIPKGVFIESQAAYKLDRFVLGDNIRETSGKKYFEILGKYKNWTNEKHKELVRGNSNSATNVLRDKVESIKKVINSEENKLLLTVSV